MALADPPAEKRGNSLLLGIEGGQGYAKLLEAQGQGSEGSSRMMALYQDLVHNIRGPKHAAALYAEYDDKRCVVRRKECIYVSEQNPDNGKYTEAFELGCFAGYKAANRNLLRVEVHKCRFRGDGGCEQHWVYAEDEQARHAPRRGRA